VARGIILVSEGLDPTGLLLQFLEVFWIPVVATSQQVPQPGFTSRVPLATGAQSPIWQANGATAAELTALQLGSVVEFVQQITIPLAMFSDTASAVVADQFYRYFFGKTNGTGFQFATALPSAFSYVGAYATVLSATVAAASNGAALPQATLNVSSTAGLPANGTLYVPAVQPSGAQAGQITVQAVTYTGVTATTFTGCSGGTGALYTGGVVDVETWVAG
jgi:hypothetical protein